MLGGCPGRPAWTWSGAEVMPMGKGGGLTAEMCRVGMRVRGERGVVRCVGKWLPEGKMELSRLIGLPRECAFYSSHISRYLRDSVPRVLYADGDMQTGRKVLLMEDCGADTSVVQAGLLFGPGSPLNWGVDLPAEGSGGLPSAREVTEAAFALAARFHARFWGDASLLGQGQWLRGVQWLMGEGRESWMAAQNAVAESWRVALPRRKNVRWEKGLLSIIESCINNASWENWMTHPDSLRQRPWTLVHADFHPGNMLWSPNARRITLLDWELVGVGSGPQDLAQFVISHMEPSLRRSCEKDLVASYHQQLLTNGVKDYPLEECWRDYVHGGCEKWVWLVAIMAAGGHPDAMIQYFQDQLWSFVQDHRLRPDSVCMPRV